MGEMNRAGLLALASILGVGAGCFGSDSKECMGADGIAVLCPASAICVNVGTAAACQLPDVALCGDGIVEPGEVCDDGNTRSGDGCSADCKSNETCGNGIIDTAVGEQCDDGNLLSHDGCDSKCSAELPHWIQVAGNDLPNPIARISPCMTYDARHGQVVMFGGARAVPFGNGVLDDTWSWTNGWHQLFPFDSPSPRSSCVLAYAGVDGRSYLFGGIDSGDDVFADLWRWNGNVWENVPTADQPQGVWAATMVYDAHRQRLVLYGGTNAVGASVDATWELDFSTGSAVWTEVPIQAGSDTDPGPRAGQAMAYDAAHMNIVMWGGDVVTRQHSTALTDTWTYDATGWTKQAPKTQPAAGSGEMGFDGTEIVLSTGNDPSTDPMYVWDGSDWHEVAGPGSGSAASRPAAAMAFAPPGQLVLFGGIDTAVNGFSDETDVWPSGGSAAGTGSAFFAFTPQSVGRAAESADLDLGLGAPLVFGGFSQAETGGEAALITDSLLDLVDDNWIPAATIGAGPSARTEIAAAFDESRVETVMFGGREQLSGASTLDETWSWSYGAVGGTWRQENPASAPAARFNHAMAYDASRQKVILFGGVDSRNDTLGDTWEWDGAAETWSEDLGSASPPARQFAALAYDRTHQQTVLFGGQDGSGQLLDDTWLLTEEGWSNVVPVHAPSARTGAAMAWNPVRKRVVLFGGQSTVLEQDTWEWDGTDWTQSDRATAGASGRCARRRAGWRHAVRRRFDGRRDRRPARRCLAPPLRRHSRERELS